MKTKHLIYLVVALCVLSLGKVVYGLVDFVSNRKDYLQVKSESVILEELKKLKKSNTKNQDQGKSYDRFKILYQENITGWVKPEEIATGPGNDPVTPTNAIANILSVVYIQFDEEDSKKSRACVDYKDEELKSASSDDYAILYEGDHLPASYKKVVLTKIGLDELTFQFEGEEKEETVSLGVFDLSSEFSVMGDGVSNGGSSGSRSKGSTKTRGYPSNYETPDVTTLKGEDEWWISYDEARTYKNEYQSILKDVSFSTARDKDQKVIGLRINSIGQGAIVYAHGAQKGDIVKSINGVPVTSKAQAINYVKSNPNLSQYVVVFERRGKEMTKTIVPPPKK